ncbi:fasciclin-like arabinogalactan protein 3 [Diospyros lotus]|uniref:fasciclin-like arabinogalactan protein 3 n=1 Tax=Diospyros lotus TaxID=55363 RepID=UPI00225366B9|nr:fasciclin-like arabinogalactan protein 3 [Diospyros lotus]
MGPRSSVAVTLSCLLAVVLISSSASAFNISRLLGRFPEFSVMRDLLNQTDLVGEINSRQSITILAVDNGALGSLSGEPLELVRRILSVHVILDYYDIPKIQQLSRKQSIVTTLYQSSGVADSMQGFLNITSTKDHKIGFASAVKGSPVDVKLVKMVACQPYNISVLQVSGVITPPGIDGKAFLTPGPEPKKSAPVPAPAPSKHKKNIKSPAPSPDAEEAEAPEAESPANSPADSPGPAADADEDPAADEESDDEAAPSPTSSAVHFASSSLGGLVLAAVALGAAF